MLTQVLAYVGAAPLECSSRRAPEAAVLATEPGGAHGAQKHTAGGVVVPAEHGHWQGAGLDGWMDGLR